MRRFIRPLVLLVPIAAVIAGCPESTPGGGNGNGNGGDALHWPEALAVVPGGMAPDVAVSAMGEILLTLSREGRSELIVDPAGEARVVDIGPGGGGRIAAASDTDQAVVIFHETGTKLLAAWISAGELEAPAFEIVDDRDDWGWSRYVRGVSVYWTASGPAAFMHSHLPDITEYAADGSVAFRQDARADFILQRIPLPERGSVRLPPLSSRLGTGSYHMISHGEAPTIFDLHDHEISSPEEPRVLAVLSRAVRDSETDQPQLQWNLAEIRPEAIGSSSIWYGPIDEGGAPLPIEGYPTWIGLHRLGPRHGVATWLETSGSMVYDVFMASMTIDDDGFPVLGETFVNVSQTYGSTDHSEHPVVRAAGDGRIWVTWRETSFGPRVALYDQDLKRLGIAAPAVELHQNPSAPLGAAVLPDGDLLIASEVWPNDEPSEVRLWRIELP